MAIRGPDYVPDARLEPPESKVIGYCETCGGEFYEGCTVWRMPNGDVICEDCLNDWAKQFEEVL